MRTLDKIIDYLFSGYLIGFTWYRKKRGGQWHKVYDKRNENEIGLSPIYWVQSAAAPKQGEFISIIKSEDHTTPHNAGNDGKKEAQ